MSRVFHVNAKPLERLKLSLFEKVILANSLMLICEAFIGLWITSHNLEAHHYLIDTSFIVLATLLGLMVNVALIRASFHPLFGLMHTIRKVSAGDTHTRAQVTSTVMAQEHMPDVVVMDITMPDMDGLTACQLIRNQQPSTQVLMLTMHESEEYFLQALRMGAAGYLVKKAAPSDLQMAINSIAQGGAFLYPGLAKALIRSYIASSTTETQKALDHMTVNTSNLAQALQVLTPRELEILRLVAEGHTNQEIADQLTLSIKTVQSHRANMMEKLDLRDITHLVRFAVRYGLIAPES